jgi:hypothetical protein
MDAEEDLNNNNVDGCTTGATTTLQVRWHGQSFPVDVPATATVWELKLQLQQLTGVSPHAQKLIGLLPRGRHPPDQVRSCPPPPFCSAPFVSTFGSSSSSSFPVLNVLARVRWLCCHTKGTLEELGVRSGQRCMLVGIEATRAAQLASQEEEHRARTEAEAGRALPSRLCVFPCRSTSSRA